MPNHVTNTMLVYGPKAEVEQAFALVWKPEAEDEHGKLQPARVDFGLVRPLPAALEGSASPTLILTEERLAEALAKQKRHLEKFPHLADVGLSDEVGISQVEADRRLTEYGALNWYDWQIANWGTKWNAYDCELEQEPAQNSHEAELFGFVVRFDTAWAPPSTWVAHLLVKLQGKVTIEMISFDEGDYSPIIFDSGEQGYTEYLAVDRTVDVRW